ncbi:hypothetical protein niasHS_011630 [Heterodera schachtii]|uniref:Uncharacterized protein n=1 Tax=Heterodera schachtii TaxID=97005 RepID=A0ABD2IC98_HETSC
MNEIPPPIAFQRSADHRRRKMGQHNEDDDCRGKAYCNPQHKNSNGLSPSPPAPLRSPSPAGVVERKSIPIQITFPVYRSPLLVPTRGSDASGCKVSAAFAAPLTACIKHAHIRPQLPPPSTKRIKLSRGGR